MSEPNFDYAVITSPHTGRPIGGSCSKLDGETATIVFGGFSLTGPLAKREFGLASFIPGAGGRAPSR